MVVLYLSQLRSSSGNSDEYISYAVFVTCISLPTSTLHIPMQIADIGRLLDDLEAGRQCLSPRHTSTVTVLVSDDNAPRQEPRPPTPQVGTRLACCRAAAVSIDLVVNEIIQRFTSPIRLLNCLRARTFSTLLPPFASYHDDL